MFNLYFGDVIATLTTVLVAGMLIFMVTNLASRRNTRWGRRIGIFILVGTVISALAATRDAYGTAEALMAMESLTSSLCSLAGGGIFLTGFVSLFSRKQSFKKKCFRVISFLFTFLVVITESYRLLVFWGVI